MRLDLMTPQLFLGYSSKPEVTRDTLQTAAREIGIEGNHNVISWEDLAVSGRLIIGRILETITDSSACIFDVSNLNQNVLFELGFAIGKAKPVMVLLDKTDSEAKRNWLEFQLLNSVGYVLWENSLDIKAQFLQTRPDRAERTLYDDLIENDTIGPFIPGSIFYVQPYHNTEPARRIERRLKRETARGVQIFYSDPTESAINPFSWYAAKAYESACTIVHFESQRRELASLHNPRSALVAGFAFGLGRPLLMLAEHDYMAPVDYGDLLRTYSSASQAETRLEEWLGLQDIEPPKNLAAPSLRLATELRSLRFGEHVAENEADHLNDYFVPTRSFDDVIADRSTLFVGRKGTGKTANMLQAAEHLSSDARNLVVVIKPAAYEFSSLLELLKILPVSHQQYSIEGIWKFLISSEIANRVIDSIESRSPYLPRSEDELRLLEYVEKVPFRLREEFSTRFEWTVKALSAITSDMDSRTKRRDFINEALHSTAISHIQSLLGPLLKDKKRIALLVDNLDKGWERTSDLDLLAKLLLGLISAIGRIKIDFSKEDSWRQRMTLTIAIFIRGDIFSYVAKNAREPDKIASSQVNWQDKETLLRVIEERFLAIRPNRSDAGELWTKFVCPEISGIKTRDYLATRVLPRPRDLIYLCNAAVGAAVSRGNSIVEEDDIRAGEMAYSQFAFESLLVENGITISEFKDVLLEFIAEPSILTRREIHELIAKSGISKDKVESVFDRLLEVSFLGLETSVDNFEFPPNGVDMERVKVLARKHSELKRTEPRYTIHQGYRPYLEIRDI